jgi:hypothetical protein
MPRAERTNVGGLSSGLEVYIRWPLAALGCDDHPPIHDGVLA